MNFFRFFPKTMDSSGNVLANLTKKVLIRRALKDASVLYYKYKIKDGERLDSLSHKLYGVDDLQWIIMLVNDIMDPRQDLPMSYMEFQAFLKDKYGSVEGAMATVHHYEDENGVIVDAQFPLKTPVYCYEYEEMLNESKRELKIVRPEYITEFKREFNRIMG